MFPPKTPCTYVLTKLDLFITVGGETEVVKLWLEKAESKNLVLDQRAVDFAVRNHFEDIIELLLEDERFDVNKGEMAFGYGCETPFHWACHDGLKGVLQLLLKYAKKKGLKVNAKNHSGHTGLAFACVEGNELAVHQLLEAAEDLKIELNTKNDYGRTPFILACKHGKEQVVDLMFKYCKTLGIDVNVTDNEGMTGLMWACKNQHYGVVSVIFKEARIHHIDFNVKDKGGRTAYFFARHSNKKDGDDVSEIFHSFKGKKFDIDFADGKEDIIWGKDKAKKFLEMMGFIVPESDDEIDEFEDLNDSDESEEEDVEDESEEEDSEDEVENESEEEDEDIEPDDLPDLC